MASLELTRTSASPAYRISKTGLNMLTRTWAAERRAEGIAHQRQPERDNGMQ